MCSLAAAPTPTVRADTYGFLAVWPLASSSYITRVSDWAEPGTSVVTGTARFISHANPTLSLTLN